MAPPSRELGLFSPLPRWETPWTDFLLSYGIQAVVVAIFVWIPILHPEILERPKPDYHAIELVPTPVPVNHQPQRQLPKRIEVAKLDPPPCRYAVAGSSTSAQTESGSCSGSRSEDGDSEA